MKMIAIITPYAYLKKFGDVSKKLYTRTKVLMSKTLEPNYLLVDKHFNYITDKQEKERILNEWSGSKVEVLLIEETTPDVIKELAQDVYISFDTTRAIRDIALWFPESTDI